MRFSSFLAFGLIVVWALGACAPSSENQQSPTSGTIESGRHSVLLITVDTTRPDRLGPYGADDVATPVLDRLASRGVVFENAWAVAPITLVSHTSILSGLYPFEHGVRNNGIQYVPQSVTTLAERLQEDGYKTGAFVSAAVLEKRYGLDQGFDVYDDDLSNRRNLSPRMVADRPAEFTVASTKAWLDTLEPDDKFFAWVHFYDPHASYSPPPPFRDEYRDRLYDGEIAYMDEQIGRLLQHPKLLGGSAAEAEEPVIMVIGDHGESLGEHGERTHAILAYDSTLHVPWILRAPGGPSGLRVKEPVGHVDLMPTVLSFLGLEPDPSQPMSGRDLTQVLLGKKNETARPYYSETYLPFYTYGWAKLKVLHRGRWKLIDAPEPELYDRLRDPRQLTDLHANQTDVAHDMKRDLDEWLSRFDADNEAELELDPESLAKLRSLGYMSVGSGKQVADAERPNPMIMIEQHVGLEQSRMLLADRLFVPAQRRLESVLRRDPQNLAAMIDLIRALEGQSKIEEAVSMAERALELDPDYTQTYMHLARLEAQREEFEKALELARLAADKDPYNPEIQVQMAGFLNRLGRHREVAEVLEATLENHPDHPRTNAVYAHWVETRRGRLEAAEERLTATMERDPFLTQGWLFFGRLLERLQRPTEAEEKYRSGLQSRPDDADLHGALGHLLARSGRHTEAVVQLREAIRLVTKPRTELHVSLAGSLAELGRGDEAQRELNKVLAMDPTHPGARNNAAVALYRSGRVEAARAELRGVIAEFPKHADSHNNLAAIAVDQQDWAEAIEHSRHTLELVPGMVEAWNNLAIGLEETRQLGEAEEAYQKALELDPGYWAARFNLGILLNKKGEHAAAAESFNSVLMQVPNHAESHLELGALFADQLADPGQAKIHWNAFLRHGHNHPRREEIRRRMTEL